MERENFDDSWKKAFEKAEVDPSENVWTNVALDLERAKGNKLKKRLVIFQLLTAAAVLFAIGLGVGVFIMKNSYEDAARQLAAKSSADDKSLVAKAEPQLATTPQADTNVNQLSTTTIEADDKTSTITTSEKSTTITFRTNAGNNDGQDDILIAENKESADHTGFFTPFRRDLASNNLALLPHLYRSKDIKLLLPATEEAEPDPVQLMLAKLEQREMEVREEEGERKAKTQRSEKLWTSVGFAAGSFAATNGGVSGSRAPAAFAQNSSIANNEAKASGVSYTVGANIGTKLSERWIFQGGVNYLTQSSDYTARAAVISSTDAMSFRPASINELDKISASDMPAEEQLVSTVPYNVNNNLRYLSIPMQAGYMVINKNFGLQLNAGVSTDVFLQNTVTAEGENFDKTHQEIGDNSPYRPVNLSGLAGTELSYRFSKNYRIALNPGIRYPFSSIYRSELAVKSTPVTFDIGLRFRYIFH